VFLSRNSFIKANDVGWRNSSESERSRGKYRRTPRRLTSSKHVTQISASISFPDVSASVCRANSIVVDPINHSTFRETCYAIVSVTRWM
jgi:hypothetical protein